jgi:hypothetical protein
MKRRLSIGLAAGALLAAMLSGVASAKVEVFYMIISEQAGDCVVSYDPDSNIYISGPGDVHAVVNKNGAKATCKFTDTSGIFESNAEVGYTTDSCSLIAIGSEWGGGSGKVTATPGGNITLHCTFAAPAP